MQQLDKKAAWLFFLSNIPRALIPAIFILFWGSIFIVGLGDGVTYNKYSGDMSLWLWFAVPVFIVACFVWAKLSYHFYRYELTDAGFRKELGVVYKRYVTIPYDRIQNVDIYRGILSRMLGLSDLHIQTAGMSTGAGAAGAGSEGRLPALSQEVAEQLRDELIQRAQKNKTQGV